MVQYKKNTVKQRILSAALNEFALKGYKKSTISGIADKAEIATGNIYRYFKSKSDLFLEVIPETFVNNLLSIISNKVTALEGVKSIVTLSNNSDFHLFSAEMIDFIIENRSIIIILLIGSEGSIYENVPRKIMLHTRELAIKYFKSINPDITLTKIQQELLYTVYWNSLRTTSEIMQKYSDTNELREALSMQIKYHQGGLGNIFN